MKQRRHAGIGAPSGSGMWGILPQQWPLVAWSLMRKGFLAGPERDLGFTVSYTLGICLQASACIFVLPDVPSDTLEPAFRQGVPKRALYSIRLANFRRVEALQ